MEHFLSFFLALLNPCRFFLIFNAPKICSSERIFNSKGKKGSEIFMYEAKLQPNHENQNVQFRWFPAERCSLNCWNLLLSL